MSNNIRNFCIIAHIDHGKSTLADRFLELTKTIPQNKMEAQYLDGMDLERERGITIKMQPVRMIYYVQMPNATIKIINKSQTSNLKSQNKGNLENINKRPDFAGALTKDLNAQMQNSKFILNLIDTPGHMDFAYEVERSLAAVEGAILLIDATKGIQAQTLANLRLAQKQHLKIIPVLNKMDLPAAQINRARIQKEIAELLGEKEILAISAKEGWGVEKVLQKVISDIPAPSGGKDNNFKALVFDSKYDPYKGIIAYVRIFQGFLKKQAKIRLLNARKEAEAIEVGYFIPNLNPQPSIEAGEIGYIATGLKDSQLVKVGETIIKYEGQSPKAEEIKPLPGYQEPEPLVFANVFPSETKSFPQLADSLAKLHLNDASFRFEPVNHTVLGRGFKVGFLGMLHLEIVFERLKREYSTKIILTSPTVVYKVKDKKGKELEIFSAQDLPPQDNIQIIKEPWIEIEIITPTQYSSKIHELLKRARGEFKETKTLSGEDIILKYHAPLGEIIENFLDNLKSVSQGYASFNYKLIGYRPIDLVKLEFAIAGETKPSLSRLVPRNKAYGIAREFLTRLKENLPRQQFSQALQAKIGAKVIAREDIRAMKKNVTVSLYGGDYTRKKKLLVKQRKGKKKLLLHAKVRIPEEVYLKILKRK